MYSKQLEKKLAKRLEVLKIKYDLVQKSPYSESYYSDGEIDWNYKPEGSYRLSDHWNFESQGQKHCILDYTEDYTQEWLLCQYRNGVYHLIERVFSEEEQALENRCRDRHNASIEKFRQKYFAKQEREEARRAKEQAKYLAKREKALKKGGEYLVRYRTSVKQGRRFIEKVHEEKCYCQGKWAYTSNGRKRVFELVF